MHYGSYVYLRAGNTCTRLSIGLPTCTHFLLITSYKSSIFLYTPHFLTYLCAVKPLLSVQHGTRGCPYLRKCPQLRNNKYNMYIVFCHVPLKAKSRHLASLEKPEKGEATRYKHCGCMLNTQVMHCDCHT